MDGNIDSSILDRIAVGLIVLDPDGEERFRSRRVADLIRGTQLEDAGRMSRRLASLSQRCLAAGETEVETFEGGEGSGGVLATASSAPDGGVVITLEALDSSSVVQQRVQQFVSHVTHDLRTPLTSIMGASDLLLSGRVGPIEERHAKLLKIVGDGTQRLAALLSELSSRFVGQEAGS
ncbi:MAG: histidine kinase dimerization/phospho-acceptor domain-containing protein [Acidobacteriota bacterium]